MKIKLEKIQLGGLAPAQWLRRAGYALIYDRHSGQESFSRRFGRDFYPRFHLYVQEIKGSDEIFFNLHLDHKKASYSGQTRHSADYDGELVEKEAERLKSLLPKTGLDKNQEKDSIEIEVKKDNDILSTFSSGSLNEVARNRKKSFWQKIFS